MAATDIVQLAALQGDGSIGLNMPLFLSGPIYPLTLGAHLPTTPVALDLSGCISCLSLNNSAVHVYLADLHLTGLEPGEGFGGINSSGILSGVGVNSSGSSGILSGSGSRGASLSLPLWAFLFSRSADQVSMCLQATATASHPEPGE